MTPPFPQQPASLSYLVALSVISWTPWYQCLCSTNLFLLGNVPKCKRSEAGNSDLLKTSHRVLPLGEKMKVLDLIRKEKHHMLRLLSPTVRADPPSVKL